MRGLHFFDSAATISENLLSLRRLSPLKRGYIPNVDLRHREESIRKILAFSYLASAKQYAPAEREMYEAYIREHNQEMISLAISLSDIPVLNGLYDMGFPTEKDIDAYIGQANALCRSEVVISLLNYKQNRWGNRCVAQRFAEKFRFKDEPDS